MQNYVQQIEGLANPTFNQIRNIAINRLNGFSRAQRDKLWEELNRGEALIDTHEHLCQYLFSFGNMHQAKLTDAFEKLPLEAYSKGFEVIDWGCGQGLGTINLFDFIKSKGIANNVRRITLIEPSKMALERANLHVKTYIKDRAVEVNSFAKFFENIETDNIKSRLGLPIIHIFSNILDLAVIDLKHLAHIVDEAVVSDNYVVSVGPLNPTNKRIDAFYNYFDVPLIYTYDSSFFKNKNWTYKCKIYKLEANITSNLIPIKYYPSVQFHAAYELDAYKQARLKSKSTFFETFSKFEISAPFDIGASVYDDVHPIMAVLNNLITRGLPTKASVLVEETFINAFGNSREAKNLGELIFVSKKEIDFKNISQQVERKLYDKKNTLTLTEIDLQELLSPIAIARFQKILVEAIITGHLPLESEEWNVLVEEKDVPFAAVAFKDFEQLFFNLTQLSEEYQDLKFPTINLDIICSAKFENSPLHLNANVTTEAKPFHYTKQYDMVVDMATLETSNIVAESFSKYNYKNNCYFNIRSAIETKVSRTVYTSSLIKYKRVVEKNLQGNYTTIETTKEHLRYFVRLLFRKDDFRPGQLPILDRAIQNLPVIGLLPTGGGKSLTYQLSAMLQPGITLIIDPLRSLMKDQYDGLMHNGIDVCTYINSSIGAYEMKKRETKMESSELLFVFVSPERLSILNFRERLKQMHEYNVYFSYGVIDEVHCVSEWGHDFRFSYLHLGRNLYNYVRAKEGAVSLFGLTATASFDVLADVERELSGNGAFVLDADTTVRYENTNRLELQYKIEKVEIDFEPDESFDKKHLLDRSLPKAIKIGDNRSVFDTKSDFLRDYVSRVPIYISDLQSPENINKIKTNFAERQNLELGNDRDLTVNTSDYYHKINEKYTDAGIVFCPHVKSTGISVATNQNNLLTRYEDIGSFSGSDTDDQSMTNLEKFRNDELSIMVATKAFGMGIDKPNVRFTVNMNYSSSLESFVQEAGRAGRDQKMALSTILFSDYEIAKVKSTCPLRVFPIGLLFNKWFKKEDLEQILDFYDLEVDEKYIERASPTKDLVKLFCSKDNRMFAFNECSVECEAYGNCSLRSFPAAEKGWSTESDLIQRIQELQLPIGKKSFRYLSADYETVMHFFNSSFKGDIIEKRFMHNLLSKSEVQVALVNDQSAPLELENKQGFLSSLVADTSYKKIIVFVPYNSENSTDISKAIYRMCCIELIEDFTQDYRNNKFRIEVNKKSAGGYYDGLFNFLIRYYTIDRAKAEINKAKNYTIRVNEETPIVNEIHRCLAYLTEFVYDKISEKRKRAIDDMRNFCLEGISENKPWLDRNEDLKDYIFYYFNSKYAKTDFVAENGEPYSLTEDTDFGKTTDANLVFKYLKVIDDDLLGFSTPIDNVKHLQGAVRLIKRSLTDTNPTLLLLNTFTLMFLGTKNNANLEEELKRDYHDGMFDMGHRMEYNLEFWEFFEKFNSKVREFGDPKINIEREETIKLAIYGKRLNQITEFYTQ